MNAFFVNSKEYARSYTALVVLRPPLGNKPNHVT